MVSELDKVSVTWGVKVAEQYISAFGELAKAGNTILLPANVGDAGSMVATAMSVLSGLKKAA